MEILLNNTIHHQEQIILQKKVKVDEKLVRKELVKVWTKVMEKYARPGALIPSVDQIRRELLHVGVEAGVSVVVDEHWWAMDFMVRDEIEKKVEKGLNRFNLAQFVEDVRMAQQDPSIIHHLREEIRYHVMNS